jgi:hypothetical protein
MTAQKDEQIEFWLNQMRESIKDRLEVPDLNFADEYIEDVMSRLTDLRGTDSLPN